MTGARTRWGAIAAMAVLAIAGCGNGDDGQDTGAPVPPVLGQGLTPEIRNPVSAAVERLQRAFVARDYGRLCAGITPAAARTIGDTALGGATTCERDLQRLFELIEQGGGWRHEGRPRVVDVDFDLTSIVSVALDEHWRADVELVEHGGRWLLNGLFGAGVDQAEDLVRKGAEAPPWPPIDRQVAALRDEGERCPAVSEQAYPDIAGGCRIRLSTPVVPLTILGPFGYFELDRCSLEFQVRVGPVARAWIDDFDASGGPGSDACEDIASCYVPKSERRFPWEGRIYASGKDRFVHRATMCVRTDFGEFVGELTIEFQRDGDGWHVVPVNGGGATGLRFDSPLSMEGELELK
jgi:hypothetical protein